MRIGILGGGQLGWMLALSGLPLDIRFRFLDRTPDAPASRAGTLISASFEDIGAIHAFSNGLDVATYEFENVPVASVRELERLIPVYPPAAALEASQDRLLEKLLFQRLGIPTAPFRAVDTRDELDRAFADLGTAGVLKTRRLGYDGKGQVVVRTGSELGAAWGGLSDAALILEGVVPFDRELSIIAVRGRAGDAVFYPLIENHHRNGILVKSLAPAPSVSPAIQQTAEEYSRRVLNELNYVGALAIELFEVDGALVANEMAPRVHNSGHWSIEGAETSQFENHIRAISGLPLGSTWPNGHSGMVNLIGAMPTAERILAIPGAHLHDYGKAPRAGRKLGHVTVMGGTANERDERLAEVESVLPLAGVTASE